MDTGEASRDRFGDRLDGGDRGAGPGPCRVPRRERDDRVRHGERLWNGQGPSKIYTVDPDGSHLQRLTDVPDGSGAWHPSVSPDGGRIVYVLSARAERPGLDHARRRLAPTPPGSRARVERERSQLRRGRSRVVYSRCGNYVAFYFTCKIVSVRLDGTGLRTVVGGTWHPFNPVMSPDGSKIAYVSDAGGSTRGSGSPTRTARTVPRSGRRSPSGSPGRPTAAG